MKIMDNAVSQIKYLITYNYLKDNNKIFTFKRVAEEHGVNASTVSRAMNGCVEKGIVDNDYEMTSYGEKLIEEYKLHLEKVKCWLLSEGFDEDLAAKQAEVLLERCDEKAIEIFSKLKK
ncbi:MAG: hypothetical protein RR495_04380 [Anaerovoracaceae bacterium]